MIEGSMEFEHSTSVHGGFMVGVPGGAKLSLAPIGLTYVALHSNSNIQVCTAVGKPSLVLYAKQPLENHTGYLPMKSSIDLNRILMTIQRKNSKASQNETHKPTVSKIIIL
jgi:hypothetical protein